MQQANPHGLELAIFGRTWTSWRLRTPDALAAVMAPGYFDTCMETGIKPGDVIDVMANGPDVGLSGRRTEAIGEAVFAKLAIVEIRDARDPRRVVVKPLAVYHLAESPAAAA